MIKRIEKWKDGRIVYVERDEKGRFITWHKAFLYRLTVGLNYVVHNNYFSETRFYYHYDYDRVMEMLEPLKQEVISAVARAVGYPPSEWWFDPTPNWSVQEIPYQEELVDEVEEESLSL